MQIISLNGINNIGKSTLAKRLKLANYNSTVLAVNNTEKLKNYNWWFKESSAQELVDEILRSLILRNNNIKSESSDIFILDKGVSTMEARIYATLKVREMNEKDINKIISYYKSKCEQLLSENLSVRLRPKQLPIYENKLFSKYNVIQSNYMDKIKFDYVINTACFFTKDNERIIEELIERQYKYNESNRCQISDKQ